MYVRRIYTIGHTVFSLLGSTHPPSPERLHCETTVYLYSHRHVKHAIPLMQDNLSCKTTYHHHNILVEVSSAEWVVLEEGNTV